jgi:hypothetical protein
MPTCVEGTMAGLASESDVAAPPVPDAGAAGADFDANQAVEPLVADVELRLAKLSAGDEYVLDVLRKRLISKLCAVERRAAAKRRARNAKKFVAQRGKCAVCGSALRGVGFVRHGRGILPPHLPLVCNRCARDDEPRS